MCGIVGYIGSKEASPILLSGLKRLEYRGYDSAGIAVYNDNEINIIKKKGKISNLEEAMRNEEQVGTLGIGHTRWATHGVPNEENAHPHWDCHKNIVLIHNGIIENYTSLKKMLLAKGHKIRTETDTEIAVHLIEELYTNGNSFEDAFRMALSEIKGTYGFAIINKKEPDKLYVARKGSPLVIGVGDGEYFVASDAPAIIQYTKDVVYLEDGELAVITRDGFITTDIENKVIDKKIETITMDLEEIEKGGYD
ncbi:MAG: class II glutamine amidotransferase, partial [Calditrichia bacterium]|nr:class II glutamine amidotransferase [Calditrichia bacterium]